LFWFKIQLLDSETSVAPMNRQNWGRKPAISYIPIFRAESYISAINFAQNLLPLEISVLVTKWGWQIRG
jgi:hypothetical protein